MPDGFGGAPQGAIAVDQPEGLPGKIGAFLFGSRNRVLIVWAILAAMALSAAALYITMKSLPIPRADAWAYLAAASCVLWLPVFGLLLDPAANLASGPRLRLPAVTIAALAALCAVLIAGPHLGLKSALDSLANRIAFFSLLALPFILRIWNAINFARHKARNRRSAEQAAQTEAKQDMFAGRPAPDVNRQIEQHKDAESLGALLGTVFVGLVIFGAYIIGGMPEKNASLGASLGVAIFATVLGLFLVVVFLDPIADSPFVRAGAAIGTRTAQSFGWLAAFYNWLDGGLVRIGAHVAGADHHYWYSRYAVLGGTLICLAVLGFCLPPPLGLAPVALGLVVALSVSRLWSWVEEDRNLASITQFNPLAPQRVGFREDFRDETILGFLFVLILIPIGLKQAHDSHVFGPLFETVSLPHKPIDNVHWSTWLGYFGFELAKALPIVDWADIYNLGPGADSIQPVHGSGQHAVFMARVMVDLILIAALLQALGIASRNRQQKMLYATRQIDRLDELVEKVELKKAVAAANTGASSQTLIDFRRYNEERLRELHARSDEGSDRRAFIAQIFKERGLTADPAIVTLQNIAASHRNELDLVSMYNRAEKDHERGVHRIEISDLQPILFDIRNSSGMQEFKQELIQLATTLASPNELLSMLTSVAVGPQHDRFVYTMSFATKAVRDNSSRFASADEIAESLALFKKNGPDLLKSHKSLLDDTIRALEQRLRELRNLPPAETIGPSPNP